MTAAHIIFPRGKEIASHQSRAIVPPRGTAQNEPSDILAVRLVESQSQKHMRRNAPNTLK
jgi:hypothetical protein